MKRLVLKSISSSLVVTPCSPPRKEFPPPSPPSCLDPLSQDTNTRSLIFTRGIFKLFLSFKLEILILPILIIQFSIFILLPVKQGRIGPPLGWKEDLYADEKVSLRNFYEQSEGNILLNWIN